IAQQQLEEDVVVIDLDHVSYLDMSGMWALLCFGQMIDASREVRLCNLRTQPKSVARRVDADLVLDIYSSREAAITEARQVETRTVAQVWKLPAVGGLFSRTMAWTR
ncbi:MAG: STAS domain-containing protein, partial [Pseudomonadota bacterium]